MADSNLQDRANQAQIDLLNKLDRNSDVGVGFYVGFKDTVLTQLRDILKTINREATTQLNKGLSEINTSLEKGQKQQEEQNKKLQDSLSSKNGKLGKAIDAMAEASGMSQTTALKLQKAARVLSVATDAMLGGLNIAKKATLETAGLATDLKEAGLVLSQGKKSFSDTLKDTSLNLGMAREDVVKVLKGSSEQFTKFGAVTGKNLNSIFNDAMQNYKNIGDLSSSNAEAIMKMQLEAITNSMSAEELSRYNLQQGTARLTKSFVDLSLATGKSVETLTKEQQQRNQNLLVQHMFDRNPNAAAFLKAIGLGNDQEALEAIFTGKQTAGLVRKFAGNEQYRNLIMSLMQAQMSGQLETATIEKLGRQFNPLLAAAKETATKTVEGLVKNRMGNIMYSSSEYQEQLFSGYSLTTQLDINKIKEYRTSDQKLYAEENKTLNVLLTNLDTLKKSAETLSSSGFNKLNVALGYSVESLTKWSNRLSNVESFLNETTGIPTQGTLLPLIEGIGGQMLGQAAIFTIGGIFKSIFGKTKEKTAMNIAKKTTTSQTVLESGKNITPPKTNKIGSMLKWGNRAISGLHIVNGGLNAYDSFQHNDIKGGIYDTADAVAGGLSFFGGPIGAVGKAWQYGRLGGDLIAKAVQYFEKSKELNEESQRRVDLIANLSNETHLNPLDIANMIKEGKSVDQIKETANRITTGIEERKESPVETKSELTPEQTKDNISSKEDLEENKSIGVMSLSKETIQEISNAFANAISGNTDALKQFTNAIDQSYKKVATTSRMDSVIAIGQGFNSSIYSQS